MIILVTVSHLCVLYNFVSSFPAISYDVKGITYSVMSASWDSDTEGSALGFDEFSSNLDNIKDGLKRSKENILIREQMAGMPEAEIQAAAHIVITAHKSADGDSIGSSLGLLHFIENIPKLVNSHLP